MGQRMMAQTSAATGGANPVPAWLRPASYWVPAHIVDSAWLTHGSFAAWLIDVLRPSDVIELGTHNGFSCFAFAEAAKRLGHAITINALDSWEGDDQAGFYGDSVYRSVLSIAEDDPQTLHDAPVSTPISRPDEVAAARTPILKWTPSERAETGASERAPKSDGRTLTAPSY